MLREYAFNEVGEPEGTRPYKRLSEPSDAVLDCIRL